VVTGADPAYIPGRRVTAIRKRCRATPSEGRADVRRRSLAARYASFVKLPHTFFALPFAGVGAVLASYATRLACHVATVGWIVLAFTAARFAAMGFNRIVDRHYDSLNPRTAARELPAGRLSLPQAVTAVGAASARSSSPRGC
jgi:4-hydroxybenzoate polyprenyltransferase